MRLHKFERAPGEVNKMGAQIVSKWHKDLKTTKTSFDYIFCRAETDEMGNPAGPALMKNGAPVAGIARIVSLKERAMGRADAEISLDADRWENLTHDQQVALLDHEIYHFMPKKNAAGVFVRDDLGRQVLSMRHHDYELGWFTTIADRHGEDSHEIMQAREIHKRDGQTYFGFLKEVKA